MKFEELDARMRSIETANDATASPGVYLVARLDGRSFTRLTKELMDYDRPFDVRFRDAMIATVIHLMSCGFKVRYGYTQSDEISLLFGRNENSFGRSVRKWISTLAGEASAAFSLQVERTAAFDCRLIELQTDEQVIDYFRWRCEDARRNALNAWCYWTLREEGAGAAAATTRIDGLSTDEKHALLSQRGIVFNELPAWQRHGIGFDWEEFEKIATNAKTGRPAVAQRWRIRTILELPTRADYSSLLAAVLSSKAGEIG